MDLSKLELEEELHAIKESLTAHEQQKELHEKMIKRENFLKGLVEREIRKLVNMSRNRKI